MDPSSYIGLQAVRGSAYFVIRELRRGRGRHVPFQILERIFAMASDHKKKGNQKNAADVQGSDSTGLSTRLAHWCPCREDRKARSIHLRYQSRPPGQIAVSAVVITYRTVIDEQHFPFC